jgi:hypothetical protein
MFDVVPYDDIIRQGVIGSKFFSSSTGSHNDDGLLEFQRMADALVQVE